ncbi:hypothetical protein PHYPSEUDO_005742 [Phytophthora pseudosyringae]|uniref:Uncharacterized protein n=1 Tax=Phytophthora pseudosyringae TaxID=221518 RepID=A0A8T1VK94_9STRA|nr:hypothetical protein PHYPSEUDO_005742 [Phytophthora pseudosyringae]
MEMGGVVGTGACVGASVGAGVGASVAVGGAPDELPIGSNVEPELDSGSPTATPPEDPLALVASCDPDTELSKLPSSLPDATKPLPSPEDEAAADADAEADKDATWTSDVLPLSSLAADFPTAALDSEPLPLPLALVAALAPCDSDVESLLPEDKEPLASPVADAENEGVVDDAEADEDTTLVEALALSDAEVESSRLPRPTLPLPEDTEPPEAEAVAVVDALPLSSLAADSSEDDASDRAPEDSVELVAALESSAPDVEPGKLLSTSPLPEDTSPLDADVDEDARDASNELPVSSLASEAEVESESPRSTSSEDPLALVGAFALCEPEAESTRLLEPLEPDVANEAALDVADSSDELPLSADSSDAESEPMSPTKTSPQDPLALVDVLASPDPDVESTRLPRPSSPLSEASPDADAKSSCICCVSVSFEDALVST